MKRAFFFLAVALIMTTLGLATPQETLAALDGDNFGYGERATPDLAGLPVSVRERVARSVERGTPRSAGGWANRAQALAAAEKFEQASRAFASAAKEYAATGDPNTAIVMRTQSERYETVLQLFYNRPATAQNVRRYDTGRRGEPVYGTLTGAFIDREDGVDATYMDGNRKFRDAGEFNRRIGKKHAAFFTYNGYGTEMPTGWFAHLQENGAAAQWVIEPRSLAEIRDDATLRGAAEAARDAGVPVFVRFASEMNGAWTPYHSPTSLYKEKFRLVARVFHEIAPNAAMVWCPNALPEPQIPDYYPGADAVDWVGVNFYAPYFNNNDPARYVGWRNPSDNLRFIYDRYAATHPILVGEWAATHRQSVDGVNRSAWTQDKIAQFYAALPRRYPRVKAVYWFAMDTTRFAPNPSRRINDYSLLSDAGVTRSYRDAVRSPYFLEGATIGKRETAPVEIALLLPQTVLRGAVTLSAWAKTYDDRPKLSYRVNGKPMQTVFAPGEYETVWDTRTAPDGAATVSAELRDAKGRVVRVITVPVVVRNGGGVTPAPVVKTAPVKTAKPKPAPVKTAALLTLADALSNALTNPSKISLMRTPAGSLSLSDKIRFNARIGEGGCLFLTLRRDSGASRGDELLLSPSRASVAGGDITAAKVAVHSTVRIPGDPNLALSPDEAGTYTVRAYLITGIVSAREFAKTWAGADSPDAATLAARRKSARVQGTIYVAEAVLTLKDGGRGVIRTNPGGAWTPAKP